MKIGIIRRDTDVLRAVQSMLRPETRWAVHALTLGDFGEARLADVVRIERQIREEVMH